ncbi:MAG: pirin family protein [Sandaracinaceae bacterium]
MMTIRRADERGHADHGWLDTHHTFSFAGYHDPEHMGFRALRVLNDDHVIGGKGFGTHGHRDMEIITYVLEGALAHEDSMGHGTTIQPGDVQRMSAGTGVLHSEYNASRIEDVHFLQIWLLPDRRGLAPSYEQKTFTDDDKRGRLRLVASSDGADGSVTVHTDARVYAGVLGEGDAVIHTIPEGRHAWIHVARGRVRVNGEELGDGDGASFSDVQEIRLDGVDGGEVLLFDLA